VQHYGHQGKLDQPKTFLVKVPSGRAMAFPPNLHREVEAIQASSVPVNQQADSICKLLVKHGFAQHHQALTPASMLVHPSNRVGSMLSFHQGKTNATFGHGRPTSGRPHLL